MKCNKWTLALATAGVVSFGSVAQAEEAKASVMTALSQTTISGYVDTSAIWNFDSGPNMVPGRAFDGTGKQDGVNLNVVKLSIARAADEKQYAAGYQVDLLFGPDANGYTSTSADSNFAVKNANVTLRAPIGNGVDLKIGVWDTIIGYEVYEAGSNPNYSRSYGYTLEPTQHTGVLATYRLNDMVAVSGGVAETGGAMINVRSPKTDVKSYMASLTITAPSSAGVLAGSTLYAGLIDSGNNRADDVLNYYIGAAIKTPVEGLAVGVAGDLRKNAIRNGSEEYAFGVYASFKVDDKLTVNARGEYAKSHDDGAAGIGGSGLRKVWAATVTADYSLWANVTSRAELRYDKSSNSGGGFGDGTDDNAISAALNIIYKF